MDKGTKVRIVGGKAQGQEGVIFWSGPSKYGEGLRLGIKTTGGDTVWVTAAQAQGLEGSEGQEMPAPYPYRYYGHGYSDWIEGANDGHCFTLQFERPPTDEELELLGELFEELLQRGRARPSTAPWKWSGAWALFRVGERGNPIVAGAHTGPVNRFLDQAHDLVPLVDVVYFNAREGTDGWDEWSWQQQPPDPGPFPLTQVGLFPRAHDPSLPAATPHEAFENGRQVAKKAKRKQKLDEALAQQGTKEIRLIPVAEEDLPPEPPEPKWSETDLATFDIRTPADGNLNHYWENELPGDYPLTRLRGQRLAWVAKVQGQGFADLAWIDAQGDRRTPQWPIKALRLGGIAIHPTGASAVVSGTKQKGPKKTEMLFRLDFDSGTATMIYTRSDAEDGSSRQDMSFVQGGERIAVSFEKRLIVIDPCPGNPQKPEVLAATRLAGGALQPVLDHRAVLVTTRSGWSVFAFAGSKLKRLGAVKGDIAFQFEHDGQLYFGKDDLGFELCGVAEAVDKFYATAMKPKGRATAKAKAPRKPKPELTFEIIDALPDRLAFSPPAPAEEEFTEDEKARFPSEVMITRSPTGRLAAIGHALYPEKPTFPLRLLYSDSDGHLVDHSDDFAPSNKQEETFYPLHFDDTGNWLYLKSPYRLLRVSFEPFRVTELFTAEPYSSIQAYLFSSDHRGAVLAGTKLYWVEVDPKAGGTVVAATKVANCDYVMAFCEALDVVVVGKRFPKDHFGVEVFLREANGGRKLGKEIGAIQQVLVDGERLFLRIHNDGSIREIKGLAETVAYHQERLAKKLAKATTT